MFRLRGWILDNKKSWVTSFCGGSGKMFTISTSLSCISFDFKLILEKNLCQFCQYYLEIEVFLYMSC